MTPINPNALDADDLEERVREVTEINAAAQVVVAQEEEGWECEKAFCLPRPSFGVAAASVPLSGSIPHPPKRNKPEQPPPPDAPVFCQAGRATNFHTSRSRRAAD